MKVNCITFNVKSVMCDKTYHNFQLQLTFLAITSAKAFTSWEISSF